MIELVRDSFEAFSRGDFETAFRDYHDDVEWRTAADEPDPQTYRGRAGLEELVRALGETWEDRFGGRMQFERPLARGDWVILPWTARLRGRVSGAEVVVGETYAVLVRDDRIARVDEYRTRDEALAAVSA